MLSLHREKMLPIIAGVMSLMLIAFAASTIATPLVLAGDGPDQEWEREETPTDMVYDDNGNMSGADQIGGTVDSQVVDFTTCVEPLDTGPGTAAYFAGMLGIFYLIYRRWGSGVALLSAYGLAPFLTMGYFLLTACVDGDPGGGEPGEDPQSSIVGDLAGSTVAPPESSPLIIAAIMGLIFVGLAVLVWSSLGESEEDLLVDDEEDGPLDMEEFAAAARAAADRLESANADVDNEVYRAWSQMTTLLSVDDPATSTPGEFAAAAIAGGIAPTYANELTELFEEVRYGHRDPKGEREERAIEIFRAIEQEYGSEETSDEESRDT